MMLVLSLAEGLDHRGGDACGYVSISKDQFRFNRRNGTWLSASEGFLKGAIDGDTLCMMHARFATCGTKNVESAHPYAIRRNGKVVLWGAHNGMIPDAWDSAKAHGRECIVDSKELFELVADQEYSTIQKMSGYGVITWIASDDPHHINLVRLSEDSEICVVELEEGGYLWASTMKIVKEAVEASGLTIKCEYDLPEIGRLYQIHAHGVYKTKVEGIKLEDRYARFSTNWLNRGSSSIAQYINNWKNIDWDAKYDKEEDEVKLFDPAKDDYNDYYSSVEEDLEDADDPLIWLNNRRALLLASRAEDKTITDVLLDRTEAELAEIEAAWDAWDIDIDSDDMPKYLTRGQ